MKIVENAPSTGVVATGVRGRRTVTGGDHGVGHRRRRRVRARRRRLDRAAFRRSSGTACRCAPGRATASTSPPWVCAARPTSPTPRSRSRRTRPAPARGNHGVRRTRRARQRRPGRRHPARAGGVLAGPGDLQPGRRRPQAGMRPMTPDGLPVIGRLPGTGNTYVSTGPRHARRHPRRRARPRPHRARPAAAPPS